MISRGCGTGCFGSEQRRRKHAALFQARWREDTALFARAFASIQGQGNALK